MLLWWLATALAAPCPDVAEEVDAAWAAFDDAELVLAEERVDGAVEHLTCQERLVTTEELLELFRLDGLIALAQEDRKGAVYATIRMVTIDPTAAPGAELGPEIGELHDSWATRLEETRVSVYVEGDGEAWIDGRPVGRVGTPTTVVAGEHLVQAHDGAGWHAVVREIAEDTRVSVGAGLDLVGLGETVPDVVPVAPEPKTPKGSTFTRPHRASLLVVGGVGIAAGVGSLAWAFSREAKFADDPFTPPSFGDCDQGEECYALEREKAIRAEVSAIRALYATGYVLTGLGVAVLGVELFVLPEPARGGGWVGVRVQW